MRRDRVRLFDRGGAVGRFMSCFSHQRSGFPFVTGLVNLYNSTTDDGDLG